MEQRQPPKWEAQVSCELTKATADQIWPFVKDFFNLHKWFPGLPICHGIHGVNGEVGCIRYCAGFSLPSKDCDGSTGEEALAWTKQRLVSVEPKERTLSYDLVDSNIGFNSYLATIKILPDGKVGCTIEWSFSVDPVEGWRFEDMVKTYDRALQLMAKKMEDHLEKEQTNPKWEGKATAKLVGVGAEKIWPLLEDFCSINKWLPSIDTSYKLEGVLGQPGLIRYCASTIPSSSDGGNEMEIKWCHEKLLAIDSTGHCLSYQVMDNNLGFKSYIATMKVLPSNGNVDSKDGCQIEWSFISDPVEGWTSDDLFTYIDTSLQAMAENMKKSLLSTEIEG